MAHLKRKSSPSSTRSRADDELPFQKITQGFLRSITADPLGCITFLDLSFCGIKRIQGLGLCVNLEVVILQGNSIDTLVDVSVCPHLWKINVSCNELKDLAGFERFKSFGTVIASGNRLDWLQLSKISHLEIISLYLLGNKKLQRDSNYRKHVIKCLPKVWSLDGELVTAEERAKVDYFFRQSARSEKPVRLKLPRHQFVPTFMKDGSTDNIFGRRTVALSMTFGRNEVHNHALDKRRLQYINKDLNDDTNLESCLEATNLIQHCFEMRARSVENGNLFLLLLISSLIFLIPRVLLTSCLEVIGMNKDDVNNCCDIFKLQLQTRTNIASALFSAIKLDGLSKGITVCLYDTLRSLNQRLVEVAYGKCDIDVEAKYHHIIASETAHIFCLVPDFMTFLEDPSVVSILSSATLNNVIGHEIEEQICKCDDKKSKERLVKLITLQIKKAKRGSLFVYSNYFKEPQERLRGLNITYYEARKHQRPSTAPLLASRNPTSKVDQSPEVGDKVLLGPQRLANIVSVPDTKVVLVQVHSLPSSKHLQADYQEAFEADQSLFYVNRDDLQWSHKFMAWIMENKLNRETDEDCSTKSFVRKPKLVLQRLSTPPTQRSKASVSVKGAEELSEEGSTNRCQPLLHLRSTHNLKDERIRRSGVDMNINANLTFNSLEDESINESITGVPPATEQRFSTYPVQYRVLQGNVYHLYTPGARSVEMPAHNWMRRPQTSYDKRPEKTFIRKSNWPKSVC